MKGYKAYNKGLTCIGFKYEVGKTYYYEDKLKLCASGFHFCVNPIDVLDYYDLADSEFTEVEATGDIIVGDKKCVTNKIKIGNKLDFGSFARSIIDYYKSNYIAQKSGQIQTENWSKSIQTGDDSKSVQTGNWSKSVQTGKNSQSLQAGDRSKIELAGSKSIGVSIGIGSQIKGNIGCWITLAEYDSNNEIKFVKSQIIDGVLLKEDVWYVLLNGEFVEAIK